MSLKKIADKNNLTLLVVSTIFLSLILLVGAETFTGFTIFPASSSDVTITPPSPYTTDNLYCNFFGSLTYSEDYDEYKIVWLENGDEQTAFENSTLLLSSNTARDNTWTCQVTIYDNDTQIGHDEDEITIANSPPAPPTIYDSNGNEISEGFELIEDQEIHLKFNTTDPDGDELRYSFEGTPGFCTMINEDTGEFSCTVRHEHVSVSGTSEPDPEETKTEELGIQASETEGQDRLSVVRDFEFTLVPVNDQAEFANTPPIPNKTIHALSNWSYIIEGTDEELDYPLNFTKSHDPHLDLIFINTTNTSSVLTFTHGQPENQHSDNWSVTINVTDNGSSELPPTSHTFNLEVIRTNYLPEFISDFSNITGKQGEYFELLLEARDEDEEDTLSFDIIRDLEGNKYCTAEIFPWEITELLNSSSDNASAIIIVDNLTNDHVICRNVKLIVRDDTLAEEVVKVEFKIENANDPPEIHELSYYEENIRGQTNMSNLVVSQYSSYSVYKVNATDPDQLTYDAQNTGLLHYSTNDTRFVINNITGVVNLGFSNDDMLGVHPVLITVTDNCEENPLNDSRVMVVEVIENQPPYIDIPEPKNFTQNEDIIIKFNTTEYDNEATHLTFESNNERFETEIYEVSHKIHSYEGEFVNITTWSLNLTKWIKNKTLSHPLSSRPLESLYANELVGPHNFTVRVFDENNAFDENDSQGNIIIYVLNENDPPFFDMIQRNNVSDGDQVTFPPIVVDSAFSRTFYATDFDMFLPPNLFEGISPYNETEIYYESLSFEVLNHSNLTNINFIKQNDYSATLLFKTTKQGNNFINISVKDQSNATENLTINFLVYNTTEYPRVDAVSPYFDGNYTNTGFIDALDVGSPQEDLLWIENSTLIFAADIWFAPEIVAEVAEPNHLNIEWVVNGESVYNVTEISFEDNIKVESAFEHYFNFFSSGINEIKMIATDAVNSSTEWIWYVDVENVNRPPIFCPESLNDIIFSGSTTQNHYLGYLAQQQRFYNPDDDPENTGPDYLNPCNITRNLEILQDIRELSSMTFNHQVIRGYCDADFIFEGTTLTILGYEKGFCEVKFFGEDEYGETAVSDTVFIEILEAMSRDQDTQDRVVTEIERVTIPLEEEVDIPTPAQIIFPGDLVIYRNQTIEVPIIIRNTWDNDLSRISLSSNVLNYSMSDEDEEINISLSVEDINLLRVDQEEEVIITLTNYRRPVPLKINVFAEVADPPFTDSDIIIIAGLEMAGDDPQSVRSLVTYARDLLTTSPECAELNDLLNNAQRSLDQGQVNDALRMIDAAINGCRYLLSQEEDLRREQPGALSSSLGFTTEHITEIIIGSIALVFVAIVFYVLAFIRMSLKDKK